MAPAPLSPALRHVPVAKIANLEYVKERQHVQSPATVVAGRHALMAYVWPLRALNLALADLAISVTTGNVSPINAPQWTAPVNRA